VEVLDVSGGYRRRLCPSAAATQASLIGMPRGRRRPGRPGCVGDEGCGRWRRRGLSASPRLESDRETAQSAYWSPAAGVNESGPAFRVHGRPPACGADRRSDPTPNDTLTFVLDRAPTRRSARKHERTVKLLVCPGPKCLGWRQVLPRGDRRRRIQISSVEACSAFWRHKIPPMRFFALNRIVSCGPIVSTDARTLSRQADTQIPRRWRRDAAVAPSQRQSQLFGPL
jgi:hypothetical protein